MFGQIQRSFLAIPSVVNSPKWVSRDGIDLTIGDAFCVSWLISKDGLSKDVRQQHIMVPAQRVERLVLKLCPGFYSGRF